ncbi:hypothetical protein QFC22_000740 [Naganishia vaughanmartiniae]|uniref:Uncharacterized protein n=1 Tax=Naganishia vaughanmartiniae TaxID=1424756 RepID=A0ACC2XKI0_9TREE|nr:hypothetical protein QFC22_000740 [Naganishia vaughanmartiniae]
MTSADTYVNITDFEWYTTVLVDLAYVSNVDVGEEIKDRILDVTARVRGNFRPFVVSLMLRLLKDDTFVESASQEGSCSEILYAASWVVGEYCHLSKESKKAMIEALLNPTLYQISSEISVVTLTAAVKVFAYFAAEAAEEWNLELYNDARSLVASLMQTLSSCTSSPEVELQERAVNFLQLFRLLEADLSSSKPPTGHAHPSQQSYKAEPAFENAFAEESPTTDSQNSEVEQPNYPKSLFLLRPLFTGYEINSIGYKAQDSVKLPNDLDLDATLVDWKPEDNLDLDFPDAMDEEVESAMGQGGGANLEELRRVLKESGGKGKSSKGKRLNDDGTAETKEQRAARKAARKAKEKDNPYYLNDEHDDVDAIPIVKLELDDNDAVVPTGGKVKRKKGKKTRDPSPPPPEIDRTGEMPEGSETIPKAHTTVGSTSKKTHHGLKGIEIGVGALSVAHTSDAQRPQAHFEEYRDDEADDPSLTADVIALATSEVQVVRVKKKKKKTTTDGGKKKTEV